jgi:hypothetical protein
MAARRDPSPAVVSTRGPGSFPNRLFDDGRAVLARFGYRYPEAGDRFEDWSAMWEKLKGDFTIAAKPAVASFDTLSPTQRDAAVAYMEARLAADRRLVACERAHAEMLKHGIDHALVELYTAARDSYEDCVMRFGEAREQLARLL